MGQGGDNRVQHLLKALSDILCKKSLGEIPSVPEKDPSLNAWAGCPHTLTFDKRALRMPYFQLIS
jgi:hypothetical protein